ncbi:polysaccharide deacetylase family protein [Methanosarcina sp. WH1]|uniref:polysaccharide deacetylase family protein n=1 Tax=Methanosarcina sp. WH1 TaxID=1434102 RepID=UPI0006154341|nr:polysaccharide deacetylase family protein [Methanosarcina sp. WH1]AKB20996.1 Polysaccharide deacetylase [Methanosarcina sp. WH1]
MLDFKNRDFTSYKFLQLCEAISGTYPTVTMAEYMEKQHPTRFILMRHDVDRIPERALGIARIEQELGIRSTYYFRMIKSVFKSEIIRQIKDMGHEIGYHYETLSDANGDYEKALDLFRSNLEKIREVCEVKTVCMHGRPLSKYDNRELWKNHDFKDFGIIGEAYLSVGDDLNYFSDTGRTWGCKNSLRDCIPGKTEQVFAETTDELIELIERKELNNLYILTHPERWPTSALGWGIYYSTDLSVNFGKKILMKSRGKNPKIHIRSNNTLSVTVDIEDWYHIPSVCGSSFSTYKNVSEFFKKWNERYDYLSEPTKRTLDLLDEFNITATFFVVADVAEHYPGLIESIAERGHEIACHGADHTCVLDPKTKEPLTTVEEFEATTRKAKKLLEKISGQEVVGYRAPNAAVTGWMLDSLEKIGFMYDSSVSVNSLYNKSDSLLKDVSSSPYHPAPGSLEPTEYRDFVEFPWAYYDMGIKIPAYGGPTLRFLGSHLISKGLKQSLNRGHTVFYFHPIDISHEKFPSVGNRRPLYWCVKGKMVEKKLRCVFNGLKNVKKVPLKNQVNNYYNVDY